MIASSEWLDSENVGGWRGMDRPGIVVVNREWVDQRDVISDPVKDTLLCKLLGDISFCYFSFKSNWATESSMAIRWPLHFQWCYDITDIMGLVPDCLKLNPSPATYYLTLEKLLKLCIPQLPHLLNKGNDVISYLIGLPWELKFVDMCKLLSHMHCNMQ